jgi:hypothetical protein
LLGKALGVGTFGYAFLFAPQQTFYQLGFNFNADLGILNTPQHITYATAANIRRCVCYGFVVSAVASLFA